MITPETKSTSEKIQREVSFHNEWARTLSIDDLLVQEAFEAATAIENRYALSQLGELKGKKLLDLGCGAGESAVYLAKQGAKIYACDVAEEFLGVARALSKKHGVLIDFVQADAAKLPYPDDYFDRVYANGVLHHVDLIPTSREIRRVLKKGGIGTFIEPLPYNPLINVYRVMAKGVRTEDEKPLSYGDIEKMKPYFSSLRHEEFWFFSLLIFIHFFLVRHCNPSKVRYWKKVIENAGDYERSFRFLQKIDNSVLNALPFLKRFCWNSVIVVTK